MEEEDIEKGRKPVKNIFDCLKPKRKDTSELDVLTAGPIELKESDI